MCKLFTKPRVVTLPRWSVSASGRSGLSYLSQPAVLHTQPQALAVGQRVAPLGRGRLAGRGRRAVADGPPPRHHHLAARLVLVQSALPGVYHPGTRGRLQINAVMSYN